VCYHIEIGYLAGYVVRKRTYIIAGMDGFCKVIVLCVPGTWVEAAEDLSEGISEGISEEIVGLGQS
jgi:hypothetical protein